MADNKQTEKYFNSEPIQGLISAKFHSNFKLFSTSDVVSREFLFKQFKTK